MPNLSPKFVAEMEKKLGLRFVPEQPERPVIPSKARNRRRSERRSLTSVRDDTDVVLGPEDVFDYIYAVFHSPTYRKRYAEFLKIDFPRVPLTSNRKQFWNPVELGRELVSLHVLESPAVDEFVTTFPKKGSDVVEKVRYLDPSVIPSERPAGPESRNRRGRGGEDPSTPLRSAQSDSGGASLSQGDSRMLHSVQRGGEMPGAAQGDKDGGRVYINDEQYFAGIRPEEWDFHVGGYQVLAKWLKDHKGRKLSHDDIHHYQRVVVAIRNTIRLMEEVDKAIPKWPIE